MPRKKKATRRTLVNYIIDESGSMQPYADKVREGFNEYKQEVARTTKGELLFTVTKFNTVETVLFAATPVGEVSDLDQTTYAPGGLTALYDAVANTIKAVEKKVDDKTQVITVIMTDGQENSSRENTEQNVFDLITGKEKEGNWTFVFLGANKQAWAQAAKLGVAAGNSVMYAGSGTRAVHTHLAHATATASLGPSLSTTTFFKDAGQSSADYQKPDEPQDNSASK